jgi:hypothetical protein
MFIVAFFLFLFSCLVLFYPLLLFSFRISSILKRCSQLKCLILRELFTSVSSLIFIPIVKNTRLWSFRYC